MKHIAAGLLWVCICASAVAVEVDNSAKSEPDKQSQANANNAVAPPAKVEDPTHSADYEKDCQRGADNRKSDLCAQWKAADAAHEAVRWTKSAAIATWVAFIGLLISLGFSYQTAQAAIRATKESERFNKAQGDISAAQVELAKKQTELMAAQARIAESTLKETAKAAQAAIDAQRPWLKLKVSLADTPFNAPSQMNIIISIKNLGNAPAAKIHSGVAHVFQRKGPLSIDSASEDAVAKAHTAFERFSSGNWGKFLFPNDEDISNFGFSIESEEASLWVSERKRFTFAMSMCIVYKFGPHIGMTVVDGTVTAMVVREQDCFWASFEEQWSGRIN